MTRTGHIGNSRFFYVETSFLVYSIFPDQLRTQSGSIEIQHPFQHVKCTQKISTQILSLPPCTCNIELHDDIVYASCWLLSCNWCCNTKLHVNTSWMITLKKHGSNVTKYPTPVSPPSEQCTLSLQEKTCKYVLIANIWNSKHIIIRMRACIAGGNYFLYCTSTQQIKCVL